MVAQLAVATSTITDWARSLECETPDAEKVRAERAEAALEEFSRESSLALKFNGGDSVFIWEGSGSKRLSEFDLFTRDEVEALKMRVAIAMHRYVYEADGYGEPNNADMEAIAEIVKGVK